MTATSAVCLFSLFASLKSTFLSLIQLLQNPWEKNLVGTNLPWFKYDLSQNNWPASLLSFWFTPGDLQLSFATLYYWGGHWDFRFCGFGQFLVRFFGFPSPKLRFFGFGIPCGLRIFSNLAFGFRFLSTMMAVFRILLPNSFYSFSGFAKKVTPRSHAKINCNSKEPFTVKGMHDKPSLFSSPYLGRNCCQVARRRHVD